MTKNDNVSTWDSIHSVTALVLNWTHEEERPSASCKGIGLSNGTSNNPSSSANFRSIKELSAPESINRETGHE